jgi:hypothetical protein
MNRTYTLLFTALVCSLAHSQQSRWVPASDPVAKTIIEAERSWAESGCSKVSVAPILAEDFQGTAPDGKRYDKAAALQNDKSQIERKCQLDDVNVRLFGDNIAIAYGSERALRKPAKGGKETLRCLVWTDTWLKRSGKWQIVAAQDTQVACKP